MADLAALGGSLSDLGGGIDSFGAAANDFFAIGADRAKARGYAAESGAYDTASKLAGQNAEIEKASTEIQIAQTQRGIGQIMGAQKSDIASAGFADSGTALDLARSSAQQGQLQVALLQEQGLIQENAYKSQEASYAGQRESANAAVDAANAAAKGHGVAGTISTVSGILKTVGTIATIASFFAGCWVAREVYGAENPKWEEFRLWLLTRAPYWLVRAYWMHGERFAAWLHTRPLSRWAIRQLFNFILFLDSPYYTRNLGALHNGR